MKFIIEVEIPDDYTPETVEQTQKFVDMLPELVRTFAAKQNSYGRGNIADFGDRGVLIRLNDKVNRLKNLRFNDRVDHVENESVRDTWLDVGVYGIIAMMCHDEIW